MKKQQVVPTAAPILDPEKLKPVTTIDGKFVKDLDRLVKRLATLMEKWERQGAPVDWTTGGPKLLLTSRQSKKFDQELGAILDSETYAEPNVSKQIQ